MWWWATYSTLSWSWTWVDLHQPVERGQGDDLRRRPPAKKDLKHKVSTLSVVATISTLAIFCTWGWSHTCGWGSKATKFEWQLHFNLKLSKNTIKAIFPLNWQVSNVFSRTHLMIREWRRGQPPQHCQPSRTSWTWLATSGVQHGKNCNRKSGWSRLPSGRTAMTSSMAYFDWSTSTIYY